MSFARGSNIKDYHQCRKRLTQQIASQMLESMSRREIMAAAKKETSFQATIIRTAMANGGFENVVYEKITRQ